MKNPSEARAFTPVLQVAARLLHAARSWVGCAGVGVLAACAQNPGLADRPEAPPTAPDAEPAVHALDLDESVHHLRVTVHDLNGRAETRQIPVTLYRPAGEGPFPLVIMNHGRAPADQRAQQGVQRYEALSRYLLSKGFAVMLPTRVGYAENYGDFDPENSGACKSRRLEPMSEAASDQVLATWEWAKTLPFIDSSRWLVMGQSVGGFATVATVWRHPPGLLGAINFSGGAGGNPHRMPGHPCRPEQITELWGAKAKSSAVPMLWLYWENDQYWGPENPRRWHEAWQQGGGRAEMHTLPAAGKDGHGAMAFDMDHWVPHAEAYLAQLGFTRPGVIERPPASSWAAIDDLGKLPSPSVSAQSLYRRFLNASAPRAFAFGPHGEWGWAQGDWAMGRALARCQSQRGDTCRLYAVDQDVVWAAQP